MKIGYFQFDVKYKDINANVNTLISYINKYKADLFVAPELCLTGYLFTNKDEIIQLLISNDEYISKISEVCIKTKSNIIFGHAIVENNKVYNTALLLDSTGEIQKYKKIHLSKIEKEVFTEGNEIPIFMINNVKIGINICYDLWIPEISRILFRNKVQVICCPCSFGGPWTYDIARTRAMENKIYYVIANRIGSENINSINAHFRGESKVYDYLGNIVSKLKRKPGIKIIDIDENQTTTKETLMSDDILYEAQKYYVNQKSLTTAST